MKKKIFSLVGALVLTCAMSLNVFAAGSPTAAEIAAAAQDVVGFPTDDTALEASYKVADQIFDATESTTGLTLSELGLDRVMPIANELGQLRREGVETVEVVAVFDVSGIASGKLVVNLKSGDTQTVYAIHDKENGTVERIVGVKSGDKVTFNFTSFSPVAIVKVTQKTNPAPQSSNNNNTATTQAAAVTPPATTRINGMTVPAAPKTGDAAMPVAVMAVIFMVGAAVAVFRKRA